MGKYAKLKKELLSIPKEFEKLHLAQKEKVARELFKTSRAIHLTKVKINTQKTEEQKKKELKKLYEYYNKHINNSNEIELLKWFGNEEMIKSIKEIKEWIKQKIEENKTELSEIERMRKDKDTAKLRKECYSKIIHILKENGITKNPNDVATDLMNFGNLYKKSYEATKPLGKKDLHFNDKYEQIQLKRILPLPKELSPNNKNNRDYPQTIPKDIKEYYFKVLTLY